MNVIFEESQWRIYKDRFWSGPKFHLVHTCTLDKKGYSRDRYRNCVKNATIPCDECRAPVPAGIQTLFLFLVTGDKV